MVFVACVVAISSWGQTMFQELTLKDGLAKAKEEGKFVFVDCYTSWCGPCRLMSDKIFPLKDVGEYLNDRYVNLKFDMEKGEGVEIAKDYKVNSYPTFLVLDVDGTLICRLVGAFRSGEEFLKRLKEGVEQNPLNDLRKEYGSGNRNLDFLVRYIYALSAGEDFETAQRVSQELLASLDDTERCSKPYFFIYKDLRLSPIGSPNMIYLLSHVKQFRQGVGKSSVDSVLSNLFEVQLEDILRGRNRNVTLADVEASEEMLRSLQLPEEQRLMDYIALVKAMRAEDTEELLALYERIFPQLSDEKVSYLYFNPLAQLKEKWSKKQRKEIVALSEQLAAKVQLPKLKASLGYFVRDVEELW